MRDFALYAPGGMPRLLSVCTATAQATTPLMLQQPALRDFNNEVSVWLYRRLPDRADLAHHSRPPLSGFVQIQLIWSNLVSDLR